MRKKEIYCPECLRIIYLYDGKHESSVNLHCECGRFFKFEPKGCKLTEISKPSRNTSSGVRFWK